MKRLIVAYKTHHAILIQQRVPKQRKKNWDSIFQTFKKTQLSKLKKSGALAWINIKYNKEVSDHNKKNARDRKTFAHFDDTNKFMGSSDKINPRHIKQSSLSTLRHRNCISHLVCSVAKVLSRNTSASICML